MSCASVWYQCWWRLRCQPDERCQRRRLVSHLGLVVSCQRRCVFVWEQCEPATGTSVSPSSSSRVERQKIDETAYAKIEVAMTGC